MFNAERFLSKLPDMLDARLPAWGTAETLQYLLVAERDRDPIELIRKPHYEFEHLEWLIMMQPLQGREIVPGSFDYRIMQTFSEFSLGGLANLHPYDYSPYGLDNPSLELIFRSLHGEAHLIFGDIFFRDIDGNETAFIYVRFADRPHVFEALFNPLRVIFDMNPVLIMERFVALVGIQTVERITVTSLGLEYEIHINHVGDGHAIEPTINGIPVDVPAFRSAYMQLVGLGINSEIEPFAPQTEPAHTILYTRVVTDEGEYQEDDIYLRFYIYNDHFLAVSVNGEEIWYVITRRSIELFLTMLMDLL